MPKFDFTNNRIPEDLELPEEPITLHKNLSDDYITKYIYKELIKIHNSNESYMEKECSKEDLYHKIASKTKYIKY